MSITIHKFQLQLQIFKRADQVQQKYQKSQSNLKKENARKCNIFLYSISDEPIEPLPTKKHKSNNKITEANKIPLSDTFNKSLNKSKIIVDDEDDDGIYNNNSQKITEELKVEEPIIKKAELILPKQIVPKKEVKKLIPVDASSFFSNNYKKIDTKQEVIEESKDKNDLMDIDDIDPPNTPKNDDIPVPKNASPHKVIEKLTPIKEKTFNTLDSKMEESAKDTIQLIQSTPTLKPKVENKPIQTKAEMKKEINYNNSLWTSKYNPKSTNDIIGNESQVNKIIDWLNYWNDVVLKGNLRDLGHERIFI